MCHLGPASNPQMCKWRIIRRRHHTHPRKQKKMKNRCFHFVFTSVLQVANEMAHSAMLKIQDSLGNIPVNIRQFKEDKAFGNGAAIM